MDENDVLNSLPEPGRTQLIVVLFQMLFHATSTVLLRGEPQLADARRAAVLAEVRRRLDALGRNPAIRGAGALDLHDACRAFIEEQVRSIGRH